MRSSDNNSDADFAKLCPKAWLIAHARKGAKKHPGKAVRVSAGRRLKVVTGDEETAVQMYYKAG
jgi:hypothetical protein